jgi:hypothetical protein
MSSFLSEVVVELNVNNLVRWFQECYPDMVRQMKCCTHHYTQLDDYQDTSLSNNAIKLNDYHLEGDVWTHTMMVLNHASAIKNDLTKDLYNQLLITALLHDIGKPLVRSVDNHKQITHFIGHAPISAFKSINILSNIKTTLNIGIDEQLILEAISLHSDVFILTPEELGRRLVNKPKLNTLLKFLAICDHNGRFYNKGGGECQGIDFIDQILDFKLREKLMICYIGLPCSGKTTAMNKIKQLNKWEVLSRDNILMELASNSEIFSYKDAWKTIDQKKVDKELNRHRKAIITKNSNIIIDMTNMSRKSRRSHMQGIGDNYWKVGRVVVTDWNNILQRNELRENKKIPFDVLLHMAKSFQPPGYDEFDEINWEFN